MSPAFMAVLLAIRLSGVVDRVEGDLAVVEWSVDAFGELPVALLPPDTREGDHLSIIFDLSESGELVAVDEHRLAAVDGARAPPLIALPPEAPLRAGGRYDLRVERIPAAEATRQFTLTSNNTNGSDL